MTPPPRLKRVKGLGKGISTLTRELFKTRAGAERRERALIAAGAGYVRVTYRLGA